MYIYFLLCFPLVFFWVYCQTVSSLKQFELSISHALYTAGVPMNDVVITAPPYLTQAERRAILRAAANYSGLNVLQLLNSNTASTHAP